MSVYFAQAGGYIKVGYSHNPFGRVDTVTKTGKRPTDLPRGADATLIGWVPGDRLREGGLHWQFAADHVAGEWFYLDVETVRDLIWSDPGGVDVDRMSALAVIAANKYPNASRDDIARAGIPIESKPLAESQTVIDGLLDGAA